MATRVQDLARLLMEQYDGEAAQVWETAASGAELLKRVAALPGFGAQKARIFAALLGKQHGVQPEGWRAATSPFGEAGSYISVADITGPESLAKVRAHKQKLKAMPSPAKLSTTAQAGN